MITSKTVFVLGAGASKEVGFPLGSELARTIASDLRPEREHELTAWRLSNQNINHALDPRVREQQIRAARRISDGVLLSSSIDEFLNTHAGNEAMVSVGKLAIANAILAAERQSLLFVKDDNIYNDMNVSAISDRPVWLTPLMRMLSSGISEDKVESIYDNVSFVTFNYDRTLEQFLLYGLAARYGISHEQSAAILDRADIVHPYGKLGELGTPQLGRGHLFGKLAPDRLSQLASGIRIFTESMEKHQNVVSKIRDLISEAECIVFLGFAFHRQNVELIRPEGPTRATRLLATTKGMADLDRKVVVRIMEGFADPVAYLARKQKENSLSVDAPDLGCFELLSRYQRTLTSEPGEWN